MEAPPGRYKIIERGRRLVTVDTATGIEIDMLPVSSSRDLSGAVRQADQKQAPVMQAKPAQPSALNPGGTNASAPALDKSGRVAILLIGGLVVIVLLIMSGAWIPIAIAMVFAPVRTIVFTAAKAAISRFLNGGDAV